MDNIKAFVDSRSQLYTMDRIAVSSSNTWAFWCAPYRHVSVGDPPVTYTSVGIICWFQTHMDICLFIANQKKRISPIGYFGYF
jgi:hypothetical protein